jgi:hypothetical protein
VTDLIQMFFDLVQTEIRLYNALDQRLRAEHGLAASQIGPCGSSVAATTAGSTT